MSQAPPSRTVAERRGRQPPSFSRSDRTPSPPPEARTTNALLPPYLLTPNDTVDLGHHPGKPATPDPELERQVDALWEHLRVARRVIGESPVSTRAVASLHADTNVQAYKASLDFRQQRLIELYNLLELFLRRHPHYALRRPDVVAVAKRFYVPVPPEHVERRWPELEEDWGFSRYKNLYSGHDPWLEQGREKYGGANAGRPDTP
ncbi:hypothetical protein JCM6882_001253 [Rhodosporidiobolus microsporus]